MEVPGDNPPSPLTPSPLKVSISFRSGQSKTLERFFSARTNFGTPDQERAELLRVFQHFDHNADGRLTVDEIAKSLAKLGVVVNRTDLASLLSADCSDKGDGSVDFGEFIFLYRALCREEDCEEVCTPRRDFVDADLKSAFDLFDKNGDGYISAAELMQVLNNLGFNEARSLEECQSMISKVDSDGDGKVNFQEFKVMMKTWGD